MHRKPSDLRLACPLSNHPFPRNRNLSLARSHHTVTVLGDTAYIFGGEGPDGALCPTDVIAVSLPTEKFSAPETSYKVYTAIPLQNAGDANSQTNPVPRRQHAACARGDKFVVIHGGRSDASS